MQKEMCIRLQLAFFCQITHTLKNRLIPVERRCKLNSLWLSGVLDSHQRKTEQKKKSAHVKVLRLNQYIYIFFFLFPLYAVVSIKCTTPRDGDLFLIVLL